MPTPDELPPDVIHEALWGEPPASGRAFVRLYEWYEPRVRLAVARAAHRTHYTHRIDELRQEVWVRLLDHDRKLLRYYKPERGSLGPFIARLAFQQAVRAMKVDRRQANGHTALQAVTEDIPDREASRFVANLVQSDLYRKLMERASKELDSLDLLVLREVYLGRRRCRAVAREHGVKEDRLYKRNERLKRKMAAWCDELLATASPPARRAVTPTLLAAVILAGLTTAEGMAGAASAHPPPPSPVEGA